MWLLHFSNCQTALKKAYIAGFVFFKLKLSLHCETCLAVLTDLQVKPKHSLIIHKRCTVRWCHRHMWNCRKAFQKICFHFFWKWTHDPDKYSVPQTGNHSFEVPCRQNIFDCLTEHMFDHDSCSNHVVLLMKSVVEKYLQVRYYYAGKKYTSGTKTEPCL